MKEGLYNSEIAVALCAVRWQLVLYGGPENGKAAVIDCWPPSVVRWKVGTVRRSRPDLCRVATSATPANYSK